LSRRKRNEYPCKKNLPIILAAAGFLNYLSMNERFTRFDFFNPK